MRTKLSLGLALTGLLIVAAAFLPSAPRAMMVVLGLIITCGGCLVLLANSRFASQHRGFFGLMTVLFVLLIIGYVVKFA